MGRTAATAPLSLAAVKMSTSWEASVALASQATSAIHGVVANQCSAYKSFVESMIVLARIIASGNKEQIMEGSVLPRICAAQHTFPSRRPKKSNVLTSIVR